MKKLIATIAFLGILSATYAQPDCILLKKQNDSLKRKIEVLNYKIGRVKHFVSIVDKNPKNAKFLKGWVSRAVK